jgi:hypothetical protein
MLKRRQQAQFGGQPVEQILADLKLSKASATSKATRMEPHVEPLEIGEHAELHRKFRDLIVIHLHQTTSDLTTHRLLSDIKLFQRRQEADLARQSAYFVAKEHKVCDARERKQLGRQLGQIHHHQREHSTLAVDGPLNHAPCRVATKNQFRHLS